MRFLLILLLFVEADILAQNEVTIEDFTDKNVFIEKSVNELICWTYAK